VLLSSERIIYVQKSGTKKENVQIGIPESRTPAAMAAYHAESGHVRLLVCDDARQFKLVADERHYQSMTPCVPPHREWLEAFRKRYWDFYRELLVYRQDPAPERARSYETSSTNCFPQ